MVPKISEPPTLNGHVSGCQLQITPQKINMKVNDSLWGG